MKLRKALSLTALLAGAGLGLAQEQPTEQAVVQTSTKPRTLMDSFRTTKVQDKTVGAGQPTMPPAAANAGASGQPTTGAATQPVLASGTQPCYGMENGYGYGNGVGGFNFYGSLDYLLWKTGSTFRSNGTQQLPAFRSDMPYIYGTRGIVLDNSTVPSTITTNQAVALFGIAHINPVIFDGSNLDSSDRNGGRLTIGFTLGSPEDAIEARYFQLERRDARFRGTASSVIPVNNGLSTIILNPGQDPQVVDTVFQAGFSAAINSESSNRLLSLDVNLIKQRLWVGPLAFSVMAGLRYVDFEEQQHLDQRLDIVNALFVGSLVPGGISGSNTNTLTFDADARNQFLGGQVGGRVEANVGRFFAVGTATVAVGGMRQETSYTEVIGNNLGVPVPLSLHPGSVSFEGSRTRLTFLPEFGLNVGCACTENFRIYAGYDVVFVRRISRPTGGGIPSSSDGTIVDLGGSQGGRGPGGTNFVEENLVAHGWNFGFEFRY